jgi:hypothetical protein
MIKGYYRRIYNFLDCTAKAQDNLPDTAPLDRLPGMAVSLWISDLERTLLYNKLNLKKKST